VNLGPGNHTLFVANCLLVLCT